MPFLLLKRVGMLVYLTRKGCHTTCLLCVASGRAGFRFLSETRRDARAKGTLPDGDSCG